VALHFKFIPQSVDWKQPGSFGKHGNQLTMQLQNSNNENVVTTFKGEFPPSKGHEAVFFFDGNSCHVERVALSSHNIKKAEGSAPNAEMSKIIEAKKRKREEGDLGPVSKLARKSTSLSKQFNQFETKGKSVGRALTTGDTENISLSPAKRTSRGRPNYNEDIYDESDGDVDENIDALFGSYAHEHAHDNGNGKGDSPKSPKTPLTPTGERVEGAVAHNSNGRDEHELDDIPLFSSSSSSDDDDF
jgi:hypothetical protein